MTPAVQHTINGIRMTLEGTVLNIVEPDGSLTTLSFPVVAALEMYLSGAYAKSILIAMEAPYQQRLRDQRQVEYDIVPTITSEVSVKSP